MPLNKDFSNCLINVRPEFNVTRYIISFLPVLHFRINYQCLLFRVVVRFSHTLQEQFFLVVQPVNCGNFFYLDSQGKLTLKLRTSVA